MTMETVKCVLLNHDAGAGSGVDAQISGNEQHVPMIALDGCELVGWKSSCCQPVRQMERSRMSGHTVRDQMWVSAAGRNAVAEQTTGEGFSGRLG